MVHYYITRYHDRLRQENIYLLQLILNEGLHSRCFPFEIVEWKVIIQIFDIVLITTFAKI